MCVCIITLVWQSNVSSTLNQFKKLNHQSVYHNENPLLLFSFSFLFKHPHTSYETVRAADLD